MFGSPLSVIPARTSPAQAAAAPEKQNAINIVRRSETPAQCAFSAEDPTALKRINPAVLRTQAQTTRDAIKAIAPKLTGEIVFMTVAKPFGTEPPAEGRTKRARPSTMLHVAIVTMNELIPR